jgi:hypothetical protein
MELAVQQLLPGSPAAVMAALTDPQYLASLEGEGTIGAPELLDRTEDGPHVRQRLRYRFRGELSSAVTRVVDRQKLVWVIEHVYDVAAGRATFRVLPEHYADRFHGAGTETFTAQGDGTLRRVDAQLRVRWPIVGGAVERAIASGLRDHLALEEQRLTGWLRAAG